MKHILTIFLKGIFVLAPIAFKIKCLKIDYIKIYFENWLVKEVKVRL